MLSPAQLRLDSYFYTEVNVSIDMEKYIKEDSPKLTENDYSIGFIVHEDVDDGSELIISLKVNNSEVPDSPFTVSIGIIGRFIYTDGLLEKLKKKSVKEESVISNALSILFASIREQFFDITAKMPCGGVFLPTTTFNIEKHRIPESEPAKKPAKKTKSSVSTKPIEVVSTATRHG